MVHWLHIADVAAIFLFTGFLLAAHLQHTGLIDASRFRSCFLILTAAGATLAFISPRIGWVGIAAQGVAILWLAWRTSAPRARYDLLAAIALNQVGAAALWLDKSQVLCTRGALEHVLQPHSLWHILLALSLLFFYRNERQIEHWQPFRSFVISGTSPPGRTPTTCCSSATCSICQSPRRTRNSRVRVRPSKAPAGRTQPQAGSNPW